MSNPCLPQETLDYIVDLLYGEPEALKACCLVSKSWVPRTRKNLFTKVLFRSADDLKTWKATFPDPANSPAHHTLVLSICTPAVPGVDTEAGDLIRTFSRIMSLDMVAQVNFSNPEVTFAPFRGISSTLKSLRLRTVFMCPQIFDFVRSLPLLEDLILTSMNNLLSDDDDPHEFQTIVPPTSPPLTGCLSLDTHFMGYVVRWLLDAIPNGIHFRKLVLSRVREEDFQWTVELILSCSDTLECLDVGCSSTRTCFLVSRWNYDLPLFVVDTSLTSIDLSKATKLEDVVFRPGSPNVAWITRALQTVTSKHRDIRRISIILPRIFTPTHPAHGVVLVIGQNMCDQWSELDHLFVKFWELHRIRPMMVYATSADDKHKFCIECLLPEVTKREIMDVIDEHRFLRIQ